MPWARSRNSSHRLLDGAREARRGSALAPSGSESVSARDAPRFAASATRCCWAPSCRSRSIRRRSASAAATTRARESAELVRLPAKLVERGLQLGVEPDVAEREADLTCELGEDAVGLLVERLGVRRALHDDQAEELPRVRDRRDAHVRRRPRSPSSCGSQTATRADPETPLRARIASSDAVSRRAAGPRSGSETTRSSTPRRAGPDLGRLERERAPQRLRQLEQQLVERDGAGEPRSERPDELVRRVRALRGRGGSRKRRAAGAPVRTAAR